MKCIPHVLNVEVKDILNLVHEHKLPIRNLPSSILFAIKRRDLYQTTQKRMDLTE